MGAKPKPKDFHGQTEDQIIERLEGGETMNSIAKSLQLNRSSLCRWLQGDEQRSARARDARTTAAAAWDEKAEEMLYGAPDVFGLAKAKELAHHYRWRASKAAPADYGDKTDVAITGSLTVEIARFSANPPAE